MHPKYLDRQGLTALWREALLAQKVLAGRTRGYRHHPQLLRFQGYPAADGGPRLAMSAYLSVVVQEAAERGYAYDARKVGQWWSDGPNPDGLPDIEGEFPVPIAARMDVADGQLAYEWNHLRAKLAARSPEVASRWSSVEQPDPHPLFAITEGPLASWEITPV